MLAPSKQEVPATELCGYCDDYHPAYVACPYMTGLRRTTELEEAEIDEASQAIRDRRLFR